MKLNTVTLPSIKTVSQAGAQLTICLNGEPAQVQRDLYLLSNHGLCDIPETYNEGDSEVYLTSNVYRISKFVRAQFEGSAESKALETGGWRAVRALRKRGDIWKDRVKARTRTLIRFFRTGSCLDSHSHAPISFCNYSSKGGMGGGSLGALSPRMASVASLSERVIAANDHAH